MIFVINESRGIRCPLTVKLEKFPEGCMTLDGEELGMKLRRECYIEKQQSFFLKRCCYRNCVFAGYFSSPCLSAEQPFLVKKYFHGHMLFFSNFWDFVNIFKKILSNPLSLLIVCKELQIMNRSSNKLVKVIQKVYLRLKPLYFSCSRLSSLL